MSEVEFTFDDMGKAVMREMQRRLNNRESAAELPGTLLMRLAEQYTKAVEERNRIERAKLEMARNEDPIAIADQEGLPLDHRLALLLEYNDELESQWRALSERIVQLQEELENGNAAEV